VLEDTSCHPRSDYATENFINRNNHFHESPLFSPTIWLFWGICSLMVQKVTLGLPLYYRNSVATIGTSRHWFFFNTMFFCGILLVTGSRRHLILGTIVPVKFYESSHHWHNPPLHSPKLLRACSLLGTRFTAILPCSGRDQHGAIIKCYFRKNDPRVPSYTKLRKLLQS